MPTIFRDIESTGNASLLASLLRPLYGHGLLTHPGKPLKHAFAAALFAASVEEGRKILDEIRALDVRSFNRELREFAEQTQHKGLAKETLTLLSR